MTTHNCHSITTYNSRDCATPTWGTLATVLCGTYIYSSIATRPASWASRAPKQGSTCDDILCAHTGQDVRRPGFACSLVWLFASLIDCLVVHSLVHLID